MKWLPAGSEGKGKTKRQYADYTQPKAEGWQRYASPNNGEPEQGIGPMQPFDAGKASKADEHGWNNSERENRANVQ